MTTAEVVKHLDIDPTTPCDGPLISTYIGNMKCGTCGKHVQADDVRTASDHVEDHQTFFGFVLAVVKEEG